MADDELIWDFNSKSNYTFDLVQYSWEKVVENYQYVEVARVRFTISNVNLINFDPGFSTVYFMGARGSEPDIMSEMVFYDDEYFKEVYASVSDLKHTTVTKGFAITGDRYNRIGLEFPLWQGSSSEANWTRYNNNAMYDPATWNLKAEGKKVSIVETPDAEHTFYLRQFKPRLSFTYKPGGKQMSSDSFIAFEMHSFINSGNAFYSDNSWLKALPEKRRMLVNPNGLLPMTTFGDSMRPITDNFFAHGLWANIFYHVYDNYIPFDPLQVDFYQHDNVCQLEFLYKSPPAPWNKDIVSINIYAGSFSTIAETIESNKHFVTSVRATSNVPSVYTINVKKVISAIPLDERLSGMAGVYIQLLVSHRVGEYVYTFKYMTAVGKLKLDTDSPRWLNAFYSKPYQNLMVFFHEYGKLPPSEKEDEPDDKNKQDGSTGGGTTPSKDSDIGLNLLTTTYLLTEKDLKSVGNELWSDNFMKNIKMLNNSPIQNILSCNIFPTSFTGVTSSFKIGNVSMLNGASVSRLSSPSTLKKTTGQIAIAKKFNSFLDYEPYTSIKLWIPFIGFQPITPSDFMDANVSLSFIFDPVTGIVTCHVLRNGNVYAKYSGTCAVDIPITSSNRAQVEAEYIQSGLTAIAGVGTGNLGMIANSAINVATAQNHFNTRGNAGGSCGRFDPMTPYLIISRPNAQSEISSYGSTVGYPCNLSKNLGTLKGFTSVHDVHLDDVPCLESERQKLKAIMQKGFII